MSLASLVDRLPVSAERKAELYRHVFNVTPSYRGTGGRVVDLAPDWREIEVKIPLSWRTRNYMGTIFGGSIYAAVDPLYAMMLIRTLGEEYTVWDKGASIEYHEPGTESLYARCRLSDDELATIRERLETESAVDRTYEIPLRSADGVVHATVEKVVHVTTDHSKRA